MPHSIDATEEPVSGPRLGRLVNHSRKHNAIPKIVLVDGLPHLCLFASRNILSGEQIVFNYGIKRLPFKDLVSIYCVCNVHCTFIHIYRHAYISVVYRGINITILLKLVY